MKKFNTEYRIQNTEYRHSRSARKGFTLMETLIVIGITVAIAGIGISSYIGQQKAKLLDITAQEIVGYLRYAQQKAIAQEQGTYGAVHGWGVFFANPIGGRGYYALYWGPDYMVLEKNDNLAEREKHKIADIFYPFYAFAKVVSETERRYLPSGITYQAPGSDDAIAVLFEPLTGFLSTEFSYPEGSYQQIILEDTSGRTVNVLVCKQGLIASNSDLEICGD